MGSLVSPVCAVGIRDFSTFASDEEFVLASGTQLKVSNVTTARGGLCPVELSELPDARLVA